MDVSDDVDEPPMLVDVADSNGLNQGDAQRSSNTKVPISIITGTGPLCPIPGAGTDLDQGTLELERPPCSTTF